MNADFATAAVSYRCLSYRCQEKQSSQSGPSPSLAGVLRCERSACQGTQRPLAELFIKTHHLPAESGTFGHLWMSLLTKALPEG